MSTLLLKSKFAAAGIAVALATTPAAALASKPGPGARERLGVYAEPADPAEGKHRIPEGERLCPVPIPTRASRAPGRGSTHSLAGRQDRRFSAAGMTLGKAKVSTSGHADVTRNTELRQKVPSITHGSRVTVRTAGGKLIVSGRF